MPALLALGFLEQGEFHMSDLSITNASKAESFISNQPAEASVGQKLSNEVSNLQKENSMAPKPGSACVQDSSGYIDCGPIVGYPHPDTPTNPQPKNPFSPLARPEFPKDPGPLSPIGIFDPVSKWTSFDTTAPHE
jgi:hypothetical protein